MNDERFVGPGALPCPFTPWCLLVSHLRRRPPFFVLHKCPPRQPFSPPHPLSQFSFLALLHLACSASLSAPSTGHPPDAHLAGQPWRSSVSGYGAFEVCQLVLSLRYNCRCPGRPDVGAICASSRSVRSTIPTCAKDLWSRCLIITLPALVLAAPSRGGRKHAQRQENDCQDWVSGLRPRGRRVVPIVLHLQPMIATHSRTQWSPEFAPSSRKRPSVALARLSCRSLLSPPLMRWCLICAPQRRPHESPLASATCAALPLALPRRISCFGFCPR